MFCNVFLIKVSVLGLGLWLSAFGLRFFLLAFLGPLACGLLPSAFGLLLVWRSFGLRPPTFGRSLAFGLWNPKVSLFLRKQRLSLESKVSVPVKKQGASQIIIYIYIFFYIAHIKSLKNAATQNNGLGFLRPSASDLRSVFGLRPVEPEVSWFRKKQRLSLESKVSLPAKEQGASQIIYLYICIYKACQHSKKRSHGKQP